ncbi:hypothetical protein FRB99_000450, partial [Tulasnella sp. 403]
DNRPSSPGSRPRRTESHLPKRPYPPPKRPLERRQTDITGKITSLADGISSELRVTSADNSSQGDSTRSSSPTKSASATDSASDSPSSTDTASSTDGSSSTSSSDTTATPTTTDSPSVTESSSSSDSSSSGQPQSTPTLTPTHRGTTTQIDTSTPPPPGTSNFISLVPPSSSPSSSPYTSVLVTTTATVNGRVTTFTTLVPTTLSAFPQDTDSSLHGGPLVGAIIGTLLAVALLVLLGILFQRRRRQRKRDAALAAARRPRGRGLALSDEVDDEYFHRGGPVGMLYTGSGSAISGDGGYHYGALGSMVPPSPGGGYTISIPGSSHDLPRLTSQPDPGFVGKDPAAVRAIKASKSGSSSGSIFREDFALHDHSPTVSIPPGGNIIGGPPSPTPQPSINDPLMSRTWSTDRFSTTSSGAAKGLLHPDSSYPPAENDLIARSESPPSIRGASRSPPVQQGSPPHEYHYKKVRRWSNGFMGSSSKLPRPSAEEVVMPAPSRPRRDSYMLPDLSVKGDGSLRDNDGESVVSIKPYLSEDEDDGGVAGRRARRASRT